MATNYLPNGFQITQALSFGDDMKKLITLLGDGSVKFVRNYPTTAVEDLVWDNAGLRIDVPNTFYARNYGAVMDGVTDDTAAVNSAIAAGPAVGGFTVILDGDTKTGALTIPPAGVGGRSKWITFKLSGTWTLTATLVLTGGRVAIIGDRGVSNTQFLETPGSIIVCPTSTDGIQLAANNGCYISNIAFTGPSGAGAINTVTWDSLVLNNVGIQVSNTAGSKGLILDDAIFVFLDQCAINAGASSHSTIYITNSVGGLVQGTAYVYARNLFLSGVGMVIDTPVGGMVNSHGPLSFQNLIYESGHNELITINSTSLGVDNLELNNVTIADDIAVPGLIKVTTNTSQGINSTLFRVTISGLQAGTIPIFSPGSLAAEFITLSNTYGVTDIAGANQLVRDYTWSNGEFIESRLPTAQGMLGGIVPPVAPETGTLVNPINWPGAANLTITTGSTGPDGGTSAGALTSSSGVVGTIVYNKNKTLALGDWILTGVWMRVDSTLGTGSGQGPFLSLVTTGFQLDNGNGSGKNNLLLLSDAVRRQGGWLSGWVPLIQAGKVTALGTNPCTTQLTLRCDTTHPASYWMPWVMVIPATLGIADMEIVRLYRTLQNVPLGASAGFWSSLAGVQMGPSISNGQMLGFKNLTELTTIAAAATTDTTISIPLNAVVLAVSVRVTVAIPTAATFTVTGATSGTEFDVAAGVAVGINTTDVGTALCPYKNGAAQKIRFTPNVQPATNVGRVRVTIHYYDIAPPLN